MPSPSPTILLIADLQAKALFAIPMQRRVNRQRAAHSPQPSAHGALHARQSPTSSPLCLRHPLFSRRLIASAVSIVRAAHTAHTAPTRDPAPWRPAAPRTEAPRHRQRRCARPQGRRPRPTPPMSRCRHNR
ncbi:hypothetical protein IWW45_003669 [Coemansia sp. RSA 485]|nr:hypothetical protein IWW45_003669 [Coemansia sp. RSA 485]